MTNLNVTDALATKRQISSLDDVDTKVQEKLVAKRGHFAKDYLFNCKDRYVWNDDTNWIQKIHHPLPLYANDSGWLLYMFRSTERSREPIYTGITHDFERRCKQHNGLLSAWKNQYTTSLVKYGYQWEPVMILHGLSSESVAKEIEHGCKHILNYCRRRHWEEDFANFFKDQFLERQDNQNIPSKLKCLSFLLTRQIDANADKLHIQWFKPELRPNGIKWDEKITDSNANFNTCFVAQFVEEINQEPSAV